VGSEIQARLLAQVPPGDLEICLDVLDRIERGLDTRGEGTARAAD
jgi:hypothetical protein